MKALEDLPLELVQLVEAERAAPAALVGQRAGILDRLTVTHGVATGTAAGATAAATSGAKTAVSLSMATKAVVIGLAAVGTFGAGYYAGSSQRATPPAPSRLVVADARPQLESAKRDALQPPTPELPISEPAAIVARECPTATPTVPSCDCSKPASISARAANAAPSPSSESDGEAAILRAAWTAMERGQPFTALRALERHASEYPDGSLVEERDALRVRALVDAAEYDEARSRGDAFRERFPNSIHRAAVDRALADLP